MYLRVLDGPMLHGSQVWHGKRCALRAYRSRLLDLSP